MDITKIAEVAAQAEKGAVVQILQADGETPYRDEVTGNPSTMTIVGAESPRYKAAHNAILRKLMRLKKSENTPELIGDNRIDQAAAAVVDWSGWTSGNVAAPCTPENVKAVLKLDHILEQVEEAIRGHARFFTSSSRS